MLKDKKLTQEQLDKIVERLNPYIVGWDLSQSSLQGRHAEVIIMDDLVSFFQRGDKTFFKVMPSIKITKPESIIGIVSADD